MLVLQMEKSAFRRLADMELGLAVNDSGFSRNNKGSLVLENLTCWCLALAAVDSSAPSGPGGKGKVQAGPF